MRWNYTPKTIYDKIKRRFAIIPVVIDDQWVWLEPYYVYVEEHYAGTMVKRFFSHTQAIDWLSDYFTK